MMDRSSNEAGFVRLKGATRLLLQAAGGLEAASEITKLSVAHLSRCQSVERPDILSPLAVLKLEGLDGVRPFVTEALADMNGHIVIAKPPADADPKWGAHMADVATQAGEAIASIAQALANDGQITPEEIKRLNLRGEVGDAVRSLTSLDKALELRERDGKKKGAR